MPISVVYTVQSFTYKTQQSWTKMGTASNSLQMRILNAHLWPMQMEGAGLKSSVCTNGEFISFRRFSLINPRAGDTSGHPEGQSHMWPLEKETD